MRERDTDATTLGKWLQEYAARRLDTVPALIPIAVNNTSGGLTLGLTCHLLSTLSLRRQPEAVLGSMAYARA